LYVCADFATRLAAALIFPATADDPFSISPADFEQNLAVNVSGAYSALYQATRGFLLLKQQAGDAVPTVFIATGNVTPFNPVPLPLPWALEKLPWHILYR
jgi:hypothetical protein